MTALLPPSSPRAAGLDPDNPWPGLASFTERDAGFFHGRDGEAAALLDIVGAAGLTVLFGKSGLGKSSLLRAGLFPRLRREDYLPVIVRIDYSDAAPPPPEQIHIALQLACIEAGVEAPPPGPGESLWEYFHRKDVDFWNRRNRLVTPLLVFDQFEELFTLGRSSDAARQRGGLLLDELSSLVENRPPAALKRLGDSGDADPTGFDFSRTGCKVLLSLREDFLADLEGLRPLFRGILLNRMRLEAMSGTAAAEAVNQSGAHLVAPGVTRRIVNFVAASASSGEAADAGAPDGDMSSFKVEPALLSVICSELNARRRERGLPRITPELLLDSRQGILADFYDRGMSDLPLEARRFVEDRLLTRSGYRISVALEDALAGDVVEPARPSTSLKTGPSTPLRTGPAREWLDRLIARRLLRVEERLGLQQVELTHDILTGPVCLSRDARRLREAAVAEAELHQAVAAKRRRRARAVVILAAVALCGVALVALKRRADERREAAGLVQQLLGADTSRAPAIVGELAPYRRWADPLLRQEREKAAAEPGRQLRASLALLPVDATQVDYLLARLLAGEPQEVLVIRGALLPHKAALSDRLWAAALAAGSARGAAGLRAASALALYDPQNSHWEQAAPLAALDLVRQNAVFFGQWAEVLRPAKAKLLAPLSDIYRDREFEHSSERSLATSLLAEYADDNPGMLADLLMDADATQFAAIFPKVSQSLNGTLPILVAEAARPLSDAPDDQKERLANRQTRAAIALLRLNHPDEVWPLLRHSPDPRTRSYLVHRFAPLGADPGTLVQRLDKEQDITARRALVLSLGEFKNQAFAASLLESLLPRLQTIYNSSDDPGLHAAAEWSLRQWKQEDWLARSNALRVKENQLGPVLAAMSTAPKPASRWYVNRLGQTFVAIPGPVELVVGSPPGEVGRRSDETQHKRRVGRTFALAAKGVTIEEFRALNKKYGAADYIYVGYSGVPGLPVIRTTWYQAALYCNWLSQEEGIPQSQWCYEVDGGKVTKLRASYLSLAGYRLPTEAEVEFATRAGAVTSRFYGETDGLLGQYAWYFDNSQESTWPVGTKKPNDLGFFDLLGNTFTWCQESYNPNPPAEPQDDREDVLEISPNVDRVMRGGSFNNLSGDVRSASRNWNLPTTINSVYGFRPARTLSPGPPATLPP
jgi:formylglycine-generating enzyme required for sulfatase activity